ncbi:4a-hydroxytetrahydrobiopterin dehydratase [Fimbriiglobus ruber]|uniref:4a-hydroxytetrahydrobiopterin dehydratase n=1 Tax=Fimbriiglobus ruber TaxID=1908690 RepID=A0A225D972_9BACT|nr:4a-hydroxytetrahydrobiopterin dehydratase [Fimbriiglobus ruber]OWK38012.1 Pterin-4-alpha-carbinolamine dehydratase [Fimbriiglobus ruber]
MSEPKERVYADSEIPAQLQEHGLKDWYLEDGWLRRKFTTEGWPTTLLLVNAIGFAAEAAGHHPDLAVTWGKLWVKLKTHSAGGITDKDFALAARIDLVTLWRPPAGGPLDGPTGKFIKGG